MDTLGITDSFTPDPTRSSRRVRRPVTSLEAGQRLDLPTLEVSSRHALGSIHRLIAPARSVVIENVSSLKLPSGRSVDACRLASGENVVVTTRKKLGRPEGTSGVLRLDADGSRVWLAHERLEEHQERWAGPTRALRDQVAAAWIRAAVWPRVGSTSDGLRSPQVGALLAIGAHWSSKEPEVGTVVMPTGTGKTETMLACTIAYEGGPILVVVPSGALRTQTAEKFMRFGILRELGFIGPETPNPVVGVLSNRPRTADDLDFFDRCNVVVGTVAALAQGTAEALGDQIASKIGTLIVDEAHHVPARSWKAFREKFTSKRVLQFTATPFRRDGLLVDGTVLYQYPLGQAQADGYFKRIHFRPVDCLEPAQTDLTIAEAAIAQLRRDLAAGLDHRLMARCDSMARAEVVHALYARLAGDLGAELIHSEAQEAGAALGRIRDGTSRIVVCVDMLGEGFDLPQLKIAAVHDPHKSLAIVLQFIGRFTRSGPKNVGDATAIANIADPVVSHALERLYTEDADWNSLLSEMSSLAVQEHRELIAFLQRSKRIDLARQAGRGREPVISPRLLRPKFSTVVFRCPTFRPLRFHDGLPRDAIVQDVWLHEESTLFFVTRSQLRVRWTPSRQLKDERWHLYVLHHDASRGLLYVNSSDTDSLHEELAGAVGEEPSLIKGDRVFRVLGNIGRLIFQNAGMKKPGRRNLRFTMFTGADVKMALTPGQRLGSVKSNLSGTGWEDGEPVSIGCSQKGRVWSHAQGPIRALITWCEAMGAKLCDETIDTTGILENVLIPDEVTELPEANVLAIDWPDELIQQSEERVTIAWTDETGGTGEGPISLFELEALGREDAHRLAFAVVSDDLRAEFALVLDGAGYRIVHTRGPTLSIEAGTRTSALTSFLEDYPPLVRFTNLGELDGNLLTKLDQPRALSIPLERFIPWDWTGIDITEESMWKRGQQRPRSIQEHVAKRYIADGFDVVFDDDAKGEAADLVCIRELPESIEVALLHCKFSAEVAPGSRLDDVNEVCAQAVRSHKWAYRFAELCRHVNAREGRLKNASRPSRFLRGSPKDVQRLVQSARLKPVEVSIICVQPGLSKAALKDELITVLAAGYGFLQDTVKVDLAIVCSA